MTEEVFDSRERARRMDREERLKSLKPDELFKEVAGIKPGMTCVDLGCGPGALSFPMVLCVGTEGTVYAVDYDAEMIKSVQAKIPPPNLIPVQSDASRTGLDSRIADFCLLSLVLHEYEKSDAFIAEAFRLLKPGGKVLVLERREGMDSSHPEDYQVTRQDIERSFRQAGFSGFQYIEWTERLYVAIGIKGKSS
ncbi:MAG: class I SAM-dependent methyltransferase [Dehalococcoidales bacterium]|nr:class I SAM-dependent methyltransferase [Dehalococcoidales bacterium]